MADLERVVDIIFNGVDNIGPGFDQAAKTMQSVSGQISTIAQPVADVTRSLLIAETAILGVGLALAKVGIEEAAKFRSGFNEISTLITDPAADLETLESKLLGYSRTSTQSFEAVSQATYSYISATGDWKNAIDNIAEAERLAIAGNATLEESVSIVAQAINVYGAENLTAAEAADALFVAVQNGVTTLPQLSAQLGQVLAPAQSLGVDLPTAAAAISALTASGLTGSRAFTSLTAAFSAFIKPSQQATELAGELGLNFSAAAVQSKGFDTVLREVSEATGGNVQQISTLFGGIEAYQAAVVLAGNGAEKFAQDLEAQAGGAGAVSIAYDKMAESAELAAGRLSNAVSGALIDFAGPLEDEYAGILDGIGAIFTSIGTEFQTGGALASIPELLEGFAGTLAETLEGIATAMPDALDQLDLGPITEGLEAIAGVFGDLDLEDPDELARVLQSLIDGFGSLQQFTSGVLSFFSGVAGAIGPLITGFSDLDEDTASFIGTLGGIATIAVPLATTIGTLASSVRAVVGFGGIVSGLIGAAGATALGTAALSIAGIAAGVGAVVTTLQAFDIDKALNDILAPDWLFGEGATVGTAIGDLAESLGFFDTAVDTSENSGDDLETALEDIETASENAATELAKPVEEAEKLETAAEDAVKPLDDMGEELADAVEEGAKLVPIEEDIVEQTDKIAEAAEKSAEQIQKEKEAAEKLRLEYEKLASAETIARIESFAEIEVASIEADAERVVAAFDSISTIAGDATEVIGTLFGITQNPEWDRFGFEIDRELDRQREIQQRAADDAHELAQAEVDLLRERERSVRRGEALITINGDNLEPDLRALMNSVIRSIHVTGTQEGVEQLLAIP